MGIFGGSTTTQKSTTVPWDAAQPYIKTGMKKAGQLLGAGAGFRAPNFPTVAPFSSQTQGALSGMWGAAQGPNPLAGQSMDAISGILSGDTNQKYNDLYNSASNDVWAQNVQNQSNKISDDVARQFSGSGRYGSDAMTGAMVGQLGDYRTKAMADYQMQNIANQRGILGDQSQNQLAAVGAAPGAYQQQFLPYQQQLQVGSAYDQQRQNQIDARVSKFNTNENAGWNRLNAYNGAIGGNSQGYNTQTGSQPTNPLGGLLGGALGGGSMFGIPGALAGGALGFLSGL